MRTRSRCPVCGSRAVLVEIGHARKLAGIRYWYECAECDHQFSRDKCGKLGIVIYGTDLYSDLYDDVQTMLRMSSAS